MPCPCQPHTVAPTCCVCPPNMQPDCVPSPATLCRVRARDVREGDYLVHQHNVWVGRVTRVEFGVKGAPDLILHVQDRMPQVRRLTEYVSIWRPDPPRCSCVCEGSAGREAADTIRHLETRIRLLLQDEKINSRNLGVMRTERDRAKAERDDARGKLAAIKNALK